MPKTKISEYSATANSNTDVASINIDEGCAPSGINNAIRAIMGHLKDFQSGTSNDPFTVGSSGSLTLSYGTANGVAYLNGSKALTTGNALTFDGTKLGVATGYIDVVSSNFSGSPLIGARFNASNFRMGVGIGNSNGFPFLGVNVNNAANDNGTFDINGWASRLRLDNGVFQLQTSSASGVAGGAITWTTPLYIDTSGNVGIGTSSPGAKLEVTVASSDATLNQEVLRVSTTGRSAAGGTAGRSAVISFYDSANGTLTGAVGGFRTNSNVDFSGGLKFFYNSASASSGVSTLSQGMILDSSGNLGLGVTPSASWSAQSAFQVNARSAFAGSSNFTAVSTNAIATTAGWGANYLANGTAALYTQSVSTGAHQWYTAASGTAGNAISFTQAMTLDDSGNLIVAGTASGLTNNNSQQITANGYLISNHVNGTSSGSVYVYFGYNGSSIGSITQNGTTGVLYNLTSDYRLKNDQQALTGAKDFIMALKPKKWQWWDGSGEGVGFVAHEFMEVAKHSGNGEKDAVDADGKPVYQSIQPSSSEVMANLVAFVQELKAEIDSLKSQLNGA